MAKRFSDRTISILRASGWQEGRCVSVEGIEGQIFALCGLRMPPVVRQFLIEFAGIRLIQPQVGEVSRFEPINAATSDWHKSSWLVNDSSYRALCDLTKGDLFPLGP